MFFNGAIEIRNFVFPKIENVKHRLLGEKRKSGDGFLFFGLEIHFAQRFFGFESRAAAKKDALLQLDLRIFLFL